MGLSVVVLGVDSGVGTRLVCAEGRLYFGGPCSATDRGESVRDGALRLSGSGLNDSVEYDARLL